jgi:predicted lipoprotein with Yx(FWY)xxD motif
MRAAFGGPSTRQEFIMGQSMRLLLPTLAASVLLAACGSSSSSKRTTSAAQSQPVGTQSGGGGSGALVKTASNTKLGTTVLVDARGMTLYHLSGEQGGKFICASAACTQVWHPLTAPAGSTPRGSVGSLAAVKRPDGGKQVTYQGTPLYTFAQDTAPGQANGQGFKDVGTWTAVTVASSAGSAPSAPASSGSEGSGGGRYGY